VCECEVSALGILHTFHPWPIGANKYTAGCRRFTIGWLANKAVKEFCRHLSACTLDGYGHFDNIHMNFSAVTLTEVCGVIIALYSVIQYRYGRKI